MEQEAHTRHSKGGLLPQKRTITLGAHGSLPTGHPSSAWYDSLQAFGDGETQVPSTSTSPALLFHGL